MALAQFKSTVATANGKNEGTAVAAPVDVNTVNTSVAAINYTTVAANIATLVADGASPTQAHVTTLNTNWATLKALIDAAVTAAAAAPTSQTGGVVAVIDLAAITDWGQLEAAFRSIRHRAIANGLYKV